MYIYIYISFQTKKHLGFWFPVFFAKKYLVHHRIDLRSVAGPPGLKLRPNSQQRQKSETTQASHHQADQTRSLDPLVVVSWKVGGCFFFFGEGWDGGFLGFVDVCGLYV